MIAFRAWDGFSTKWLGEIFRDRQILGVSTDVNALATITILPVSLGTIVAALQMNRSKKNVQ